MAAVGRNSLWWNALLVTGVAAFMTYFVLRPIIEIEMLTYLFVGGVNFMFLMNCFK